MIITVSGGEDGRIEVRIGMTDKGMERLKKGRILGGEVESHDGLKFQILVGYTPDIQGTVDQLTNMGLIDSETVVKNDRTDIRVSPQDTTSE